MVYSAVEVSSHTPSLTHSLTYSLPYLLTHSLPYSLPYSLVSTHVGDTKTPLLCTTLGNIVNILLDPFLIFGCGMGVAGAGLANALANWVAAMPLLYLLNKSIPFIAVRRENKLSLLSAVESYYKAGAHSLTYSLTHSLTHSLKVVSCCCGL